MPTTPLFGGNVVTEPKRAGPQKPCSAILLIPKEEIEEQQ
jgi:hypothetical protein